MPAACGANPDSLADIEDVRDACEGFGEIFGAAPGDVYEEKGGTVGDDYDAFPILDPDHAPTGQKLPKAEFRGAFPKLDARFPA